MEIYTRLILAYLFSFLISLILGFLLYRKEKRNKLLLTLRTLNFFLLFSLLLSFSVKIQNTEKILPVIIVDKRSGDRYKEAIENKLKNKKLKDYKEFVFYDEKKLIEFLKTLPDSTPLLYIGPGGFNLYKKMLRIFLEKKIAFNYVTLLKEEKYFYVYPIHLIREKKKDSFLIEGKDIFISIYDEDKFLKEIYIKETKRFAPKVEKGKTRKIIFETNGFKKYRFITDIEKNFYVKIVSEKFHPVIGFFRRFFENNMKFKVGVEIKGKRFDTLKTDKFDFKVSLFKIDLKALINIPEPDTLLKGDFKFPFSVYPDVERLSFYTKTKGKEILTFDFKGKKFPLISHNSVLYMNTPELSKLDRFSEGKLSDTLFSLIKEYISHNIKPRVFPLFYSKEFLKGEPLSFYILFPFEKPERVKIKINNKIYYLENKEGNIYELSEPPLMKKNIIELFGYRDSLFLKKGKRILGYSPEILEFLRKSTMGKRFDEIVKLDIRERVMRREIVSSDFLFFMFLFIILFSIEIYLRKKRGLV